MEASEAVATRFVTGLTERFADIQQFPHMGTARNYLASGLWVLIHDKYAVYYLPRPEEIVVIRVLHGSRDVSGLAERGELLS